MNLNKFAEKIAELEGGKRPISIAQIKEVIRCTWEVFASMEEADMNDTLDRLEKAYIRRNGKVVKRARASAAD